MSLCVLVQLFLSNSLCHLEEWRAACSVWITVDPTNDYVVDCDTMTGSSLVNRTCSDLQAVLLSLTRNRTVSSDCIDVLVKQGYYLITEFVSINQNLTLHEEGNVIVHFDFSSKFDPRRTTEPHYVLSFSNVDCIELSGIDFIDSPGIITIVSVTTVVVENCSFR